MRPIPLVSTSAVIVVLACGQISRVQADWTTRSLDASYYSGAGSYETPPPGGWEAILDREIEQERARRENQGEEPSGDVSLQQPAAAAEKVDDCENPQIQAETTRPVNMLPALYTQNPQIQASPVQRRQGRTRSPGVGNKHRQRGGRAFDLPWAGDRGGSGFDLPWGGDRGGAGFSMPWSGDRDGSGFSTPWGGDRGWPGFGNSAFDKGPGFGGPRGHRDRGRRDSWFR